MPLLPDRVVLISGGTSGLGAAIARAAAREGALVAVTGRRREPGEALAAELSATQSGACGAKALFIRADVGEVEQARASVTAAVAGFGRVDSLVNAAGLTSRGTLLDTTPELFDAHIAVNLKAPFFLMQAVVADLVARQAPGTIVNVLSMSAHGGQPYLAPYVAAKAGLAGLTRNAAHAHRRDRIRINGLNIGWTDTEGEDETQRRFHGAGDDWQAGTAGRDRRFRSVPALGPLRRGHRFGHRLGPERARRLRLSPDRGGRSDRGRPGERGALRRTGRDGRRALPGPRPVPESGAGVP
jgi:NAD(P)-dependent dehydrogenase (short-subunit alcohol dehydrogenase family)